MSSVPLARARERGSEVPVRRPLRGRLSGGHLLMLLAGLVAMLLNYHLLRAGDADVPVAVLARDLPAGEPVSAAHLRFEPVAAGTDLLATLVPSERAASIEGHVAVTDLPGGALLRTDDLRPVAAAERRRAMSIPLEAAHAVAGRIEPGDRIDVIEVHGGRATFLLVDAPVLAVASPDARAGIAVSRAFSVTVAVDAEDALHLALAIREGSLEVVRATGAPPPDLRSVARPAPDGAPVHATTPAGQHP